VSARVRGDFRPDIQALRTVAVLLVVLFHLWPARVPGGFVGVDVFFVVSGFLINSHILRDVDRGEFSIPKFWARRIRRLLPASLTVLVFTTLGILTFAPRSLWAQWLSEINSSIFYFENWVLASNSVDYLALDNSPSPTQHFWSLGVEEQFYLVWPLLIALAMLVVPKVYKHKRRQAIFLFLLAITIASLVFGVISTTTEPAISYFSTPVRAWEFGVGALIAFVPGLVSKFWQPLLSVIGILGIITTGFVYSPQIPFPGTAALFPVLATALVIYANLNSGFIAKLFALKPIQWIGDHSYAIYLWHWPLIILTPFVIQEEKLSAPVKLVLIVLTCTLAAVSAALVERPLMSSGLKPNLRPRYVFAILLMVSTIFSGSVALAIENSNKPIEKSVEDSNNLAKDLPRCFGAQAMVLGEDKCINKDLKGPYPSLEAATSDTGVTEAGCKLMTRSEWKPKDCQIGVAGSEIRIALAGDSHMAQYRGAFMRLAKQNNWHVDLFVKGGCPFSKSSRVQDAELTSSCKKWVVEIMRRVTKGNYDLVVTSQASGVEWKTQQGLSQEEIAVRGARTLWAEITASGIPVVAIKDNPKPVDDVLRCLELQTLSKCSTKSSKAFLFDAQVEASRQVDSKLMTLVNLDKFFCAKGNCKPIVGNVLVYREGNHLTNTFTVTLSPFIEPYILAALAK
jgi:peptidoglycan/LPS O-acetylase OafA/YrhL